MQDKKTSLDSIYEQSDPAYPDQKRDEQRFRETMEAIKLAFQNDSLKTTEFKRPPMFYSLYCAVFHHIVGLPAVLRPTPKSHSQ
jgi:hypothetical protein